MENVLQTTKNVFYLTERLIHAVKILTEVSIIWDMKDFFFFFSLKFRDHFQMMYSAQVKNTYMHHGCLSAAHKT